jgi:hypothetical protein
MRRIEFLRWQFARRGCSVCIPFPQNGAQAATGGSAEAADYAVNPFIRDFCCRPVDAGLAIERFS